MDRVVSIEPNHRILVVDDNRAIHEDMHKILCAAANQSTDLSDDEGILFDAVPAPVTDFKIDSAYQGEEGLAKIQSAICEGRPYALAFVDIRMPPGWDGVESITHFRQVDPNLQTVIFTAYSDYSCSDIQRELGQSDSLLILKKPFDNIEVIQLAHALTRKWLAGRQTEARMADLNRMLARRTAELASTDKRVRIEETAAAGMVTEDSGNAATDPARHQHPATMIRGTYRELFLISLRVLSHIWEGQSPNRRDLIILQRSAGAGETGLGINELCCRFIRRELGGREIPLDSAMTEDDMRRFKELATHALHLAGLHEKRRVTEAQYNNLLNVLRQEELPIRPAMFH